MTSPADRIRAFVRDCGLSSNATIRDATIVIEALLLVVEAAQGKDCEMVDSADNTCWYRWQSDHAEPLCWRCDHMLAAHNAASALGAEDE